MNRFYVVCMAGGLMIGAFACPAHAQGPKGRTGYVGGTVERSVSLGGGPKASTRSGVAPPRAPASGGLLSSSPRTSPTLATTPPRSNPVTSRQPGAVGTRGVASLLNDVSRAVANNAAATAPRTGGPLSRPAPTPFQRGQRETSPLLGRSERLFARGGNRDDAGDDDSSNDSSNDSSGSDDEAQPTGAAVAKNESPASVAPPSPPAPRPTSAPQPIPTSQPSTPPGESLADQLARAALRDALRTPYVELDAVASVLLPKPEPPPVEKRPESLGDQLARDNLRNILNYMESHARLDRQASNRIRDLGRGALGDGLSPEEHKQKMLKIALDYYSRELSALDALDENTVGLSDYVKTPRAQRRAELERALLDAEILHREPTKK